MTQCHAIATSSSSMSFRRSQAPPPSLAQARIASANRWGSASQSTQPDQDGHAPPAAPVLVVGGSGSSGGDEHRGAQLPPGQGAGIAIVGDQVRPSSGYCRVVSHVCLVEIRMHRPGCLPPGWGALACFGPSLPASWVPALAVFGVPIANIFEFEQASVLLEAGARPTGAPAIPLSGHGGLQSRPGFRRSGGFEPGKCACAAGAKLPVLPMFVGPTVLGDRCLAGGSRGSGSGSGGTPT